MFKWKPDWDNAQTLYEKAGVLNDSDFDEKENVISDGCSNLF